MSRAFAEDDVRGQVAVSTVSMKAVRDILRQPEFASFLAKLEAGPLTTIPKWIDGEFTQLTGSNDPLFVLHLA